MSESPFALRLSHAASWVRCGAFVRMNSTPQAAELDELQDNTVREEGTAMHEAAQWMLLFGNTDAVSVGAKMKNGVVLTDELVDGASFYCQTLAEFGSDWTIERQLAAPRIHTRCGGTPDAFALYSPADDGVHIRIADLKGGYRPIEVFPNWQLFGYLAAVLDYSPLCYDNDEFVVEFIIVQLRAFHRSGPVRKHRMTLRDARPYLDALRMAAHIALGDYAKAVAGPQCDDCAGRASCSIAHAAGMRALEVSGEPDIHDLPAAAIDYEMMRLEDAARMIDARLTGLRAQASQLIRKGVLLPHFELAAGNGRLEWVDENAEAAAIAMGDLIGANLRKPVKALTPTQALKTMPTELIEQYARRKRGEVKLVRFDRDAAVKAFSHLKKD